MYRAGLESILGIRREGQLLRIDPNIPGDWSGFEVVLTLEDTIYTICVENISGAPGSVTQAELDGEPVTPTEAGFCVPLDGKAHRFLLRMSRLRRSDSSLSAIDPSLLPCLTEETEKKAG
jgi:cyclic beta-1,2-glucan synthetase